MGWLLKHSAGRRLPLVAIIDGDPAVSDSLEFVLDAEGYAVATFSTADAFLDLVDTSPKVHCLVVEYQLPGSNGIELVERLWRRGRQPPTILVATNPDTFARRWSVSKGIPLVEKPFLDEQLTDRIREAVASGV